MDIQELSDSGGALAKTQANPLRTYPFPTAPGT